MKHLQLFESFNAMSKDRFAKKIDKMLGEYVYHESLMLNYAEYMKLAKLGLQIRDGDLKPYPSSMNPEREANSWEKLVQAEASKAETEKRKILKELRLATSLDQESFEARVEDYKSRKKIGNALEKDKSSIELRKKIDKALHQGRGRLSGSKFDF